MLTVEDKEMLKNKVFQLLWDVGMNLEHDKTQVLGTDGEKIGYLHCYYELLKTGIYYTRIYQVLFQTWRNRFIYRERYRFL